MTERQQLSRRAAGRRARSGTRQVVVRQDDTQAVVLPPEEPSLLGLPAEFAEDPAGTGPTLGPAVAEDHLVVLRRPDGVAGSLLLVAAAAAGMSLFLPWVHHDGALGLSVVRAGADLAGDGVRPLVGSGLALPLGVVAGGGVLFLLGLLAFRPARTHRVTGTVALFVVLALASGLVVRAADGGGYALLTDPGTVCAVLVVAFGVLGALKAMLTVPELLPVPEEATVDPG